jgi:preprotein translocase subunit SecY
VRWVTELFNDLKRGQPLYLAVYSLIILLFVFFFTAIVVNPKQQSNGRRLYATGEVSERDAVLTRLTLIRALCPSC